MVQAVQILKKLGLRYTEKGMTDLGNPEDTLIATLLAAQTTDVQVMRAYPGLRKSFPTLESLAKAPWTEIAKKINTIGIYRQKAKAVKKLAHMLIDDFDGTVPSTMEELIRLPGVGRKTASIVLSFCFGVPAIAVDTHVLRIVQRLGWTKFKDPKRVELALKELIPKAYWTKINRVMVPFGRDICRARSPQCVRCPVSKWCTYSNKTVS